MESWFFGWGMCTRCLVQVPDPKEGVAKREEGKKMKGVRMGKGKKTERGGMEGRKWKKTISWKGKWYWQISNQSDGGAEAGGRTAAEEWERWCHHKCYTHGKQKRILGKFDANKFYNQTEEDKSLKRCHQEEKTKREQTKLTWNFKVSPQWKTQIWIASIVNSCKYL